MATLRSYIYVEKGLVLNYVYSSRRRSYGRIFDRWCCHQTLVDVSMKQHRKRGERWRLATLSLFMSQTGRYIFIDCDAASTVLTVHSTSIPLWIWALLCTYVPYDLNDRYPVWCFLKIQSVQTLFSYEKCLRWHRYCFCSSVADPGFFIPGPDPNIFHLGSYMKRGIKNKDYRYLFSCFFLWFPKQVWRVKKIP
jgi:hypothetical protein